MIEISNFMGNKDKKYYGVFFLFGFFLVLFVSNINKRGAFCHNKNRISLVS